MFRAIHTIKGNCGYLAISPLIELLQELEGLLHIIRTGEMVFSPLAVRMAKNFQYWDQSRQILEDHHEHLDGSGYPYGKQGAEIYIGAQMLAIVHAYEAITHGYSRDISRKRPLMRAVMELNRHIDNQFNRSLVEAFMKVMRP